MRKSHIIEAHVRAQLIKHKVTKEGEHLPFFQTELKVKVLANFVIHNYSVWQFEVTFFVGRLVEMERKTKYFSSGPPLWCIGLTVNHLCTICPPLICLGNGSKLLWYLVRNYLYTFLVTKKFGEKCQFLNIENNWIDKQNRFEGIQ